MKKSNQKRKVSLNAGDVITIGRYDKEYNYLGLKEYIIGYYYSKYKGREVLAMDTSLFLSLNKTGKHGGKNTSIELMETETLRNEYPTYAKWQKLRFKLSNALRKLRR